MKKFIEEAFNVWDKMIQPVSEGIGSGIKAAAKLVSGGAVKKAGLKLAKVGSKIKRRGTVKLLSGKTLGYSDRGKTGAAIQKVGTKIAKHSGKITTGGVVVHNKNKHKRK